MKLTNKRRNQWTGSISSFRGRFLTVVLLFGISLIVAWSITPSTGASSTQEGVHTEEVTAQMLNFALNFHSASNLAVFGGRSVTDNGSDIRGVVGSPGEMRGIQSSAVSSSDPVQAHRDVLDMFNWVDQLPCRQVNGDLTGQTFGPGVYCVGSAMLAGQMTVDAAGDENARFVFRVSGAFTAQDSAGVELVGGAKATNVYVFANESALIGKNALIRSNLISRRDVTVGQGSTISGKVIGVNGDVVTDSNIVAAGTGYIEICKQLAEFDRIPVGTVFSFTVTGVAGTIQVPAGEFGRPNCAPPILVTVGQVTVTEQTMADTAVVGITFRPASRKISSSLALRQAVIDVPAGDVADETVVTYTNQTTRTGTIEICKKPPVRPTDPDVTGFFTFTVQGSAEEFSVPVGACSDPITITILQVNGGPSPSPTQAFTANVTELAKPTFRCEGADTLPTTAFNSWTPDAGFDKNGVALSDNTNGCYANVDVNVGNNPANQTVVNFYNRSLPGRVKICKITADPTNIPIGTLFTFDVTGIRPGSPQNPLPIVPGYSETVSVNVPAGPNAQGGFCTFVPGTWVVGQPVTVVETGVGPLPPPAVPQPVANNSAPEKTGSPNGGPAINAFSNRPAVTVAVLSTGATSTSPTAVDNDYTRINNAVQALSSGDTITLTGTFDWTETNAAASWAKGSDGIAGNADDYVCLPPVNVNNVTITAANLGAATIKGPGDLPNVDLEGVFQFYPTSTRPGGNNQNWTISNIRFEDFDNAIGFYFDTGMTTTSFNGTKILNNYIRIARDLNATIAPSDPVQNIGLHFSFGSNQEISGNTFEIYGDGVSDTVNGKYATDVVMQSNTSGGNVYDGLQIKNNVIRILNAQSADPERIRGIWENGHAHSSNITVSGNQFINLAAGNNPATNRQQAFWLTSHSSPTTTVTYYDNTVNGANIAFKWLGDPEYPGQNYSSNLPIKLLSNTIIGNDTGFLIQGQGRADLTFNRIVGNTVGVNNVDGTVTALNNWWGCNYGPGATGIGCTGTTNGVTGTATTDPWIVQSVSASPSTIVTLGSSAVTDDMTHNSDGAALGNSPPNVVPNMPVTWSAANGTINPTSGTIATGQAASTFTSTNSSSGTGCATVDGQSNCANITVLTNGFPQPTFADIRVSRITSSTTLITPPTSIYTKTAQILARNTTAEITFTNFLFRPAVLKLCKVAGSGVSAGTPFTFNLAPADPLTTWPYTTTSIDIVAGSCQFVPGPFPPVPGYSAAATIGTFNYNTAIVVTEVTGGTVVTAITSTNTHGGLIANLGGKMATLTLDQALLIDLAPPIGVPDYNVNELSFTNAAGVIGPPPDKVRYDFDGDQKSDVVVFRPSEGNWYYSPSSSGGAVGVHFGSNLDKPAAADFDGDGKTDVAVFRPADGNWYILGSQDGFKAIHFGIPGDLPMAADYDGDGKADIAVFRPSEGNWYILSSIDGNFSAVHFGILNDMPVASDFDGDGKADVAVFRPSAGDWYINGSSAGFSAVHFGSTGDMPVPADYDGDGKSDIAVFRLSEGNWYINGSLGTFSGVHFGAFGDVPVPADYDGDGKTDVGVYRDSDKTWYVLNSSQLGNAVGGLTAVQFGSAGDQLMSY
jgi:hypothetical protein